MKKNKRPNGREEFEKVYLRENQVKRTLELLPQETLDLYLKDIEFTKATAYIARNTFYKNKNVLLSHGFEQEDLESISKIYGLSFLSSDFGGKTGKDKYYLMMRYINQRFEAFFLFFGRKFDIASKMPEVSLDHFLQPVADLALSTSAKSHELSEPSVFDSKDDYVDEINRLTSQIKNFYEQEKDKDFKEKTVLVKKLKDLKGEFKVFKQSQKAKLKNQRKTSKELKARFSKNWSSHVNDLCYYATSKHVSHDVRKKARSLCKKYKIDYISWVKNKQSEHQSDFMI